MVNPNTSRGFAELKQEKNQQLMERRSINEAMISSSSAVLKALLEKKDKFQQLHLSVAELWHVNSVIIMNESQARGDCSPLPSTAPTQRYSPDAFF